MITIERIPTPQELYNGLYRLVRCHINNFLFANKLNITDDVYTCQKLISETIQEYTHKYIPTSYDPSFAKQLRVYMYAYRHHRLGGVSRG